MYHYNETDCPFRIQLLYFTVVMAGVFVWFKLIASFEWLRRFLLFLTHLFYELLAGASLVQLSERGYNFHNKLVSTKLKLAALLQQ